MTHEEYLYSKECYEDPYAVWRREKTIDEPVIGLSALKDEVLSQYELFTVGDVKIDDRFWQRASDELAKSPGIIYADEDIGGVREPFFKPEKSPETLENFFYIGAAVLVRRDIAEKVESDASRGSIEFLRECAKESRNYCHIGEVLVHRSERAVYTYADAAPKKYDGNALVSVVILSKDNPEVLEKCVSSLCAAGELESQSLEIIVVDNGSNEENAKSYRECAEKYGFRYMPHPMAFEYSTLCNIGAAEAGGKFLLFLNDDIEVPVGTEFLREMLYYASKAEVGAVGCKLLYPDRETIQHNGITMLKSGPSHKLCTFSDRQEYYCGVNRSTRNVMAVTGAALMVKASKFRKIGGFDERLKIAYTDMDLCFALLEKGYRNVCISDFYLLHHESLSRDDDINDSRAFERLNRERAVFEEKYADILKRGDPYYSPNLTKTRLDYSPDILMPDERLAVGTASNDTSFYSLKSGNKKAMASIDNIAFHLSDACCRRDFYEFSGWAFVSGTKGYSYDVVLVLDYSDERLIFDTARCMREDVAKVFPKEKDIELAGFVARVHKDLIRKDRDCRISVGLVKTGLFNKRIYKGFIVETDKAF